MANPEYADTNRPGDIIRITRHEIEHPWLNNIKMHQRMLEGLIYLPHTRVGRFFNWRGQKCEDCDKARQAQKAFKKARKCQENQR